jgi:adenylate kinase family enzyme
MRRLTARPTSPRTPNQYSEIGAAHIAYYPPTTFLTQLVVRSMRESLGGNAAMPERVGDWCRKKIEHELALQGTPSNSRDPLALSYAVTAFLSVADTDNLSPNDVTIINQAVDCFFSAQLEDGSWPRSKPLHHYPRFGNAYCHEYETLAQLLTAPRLEAILIGHLDKLERCISALDKNANNLRSGGKAWPSGHHPHIRGAESWSTAAVFQFVHCMDRLVTEAIRQNVFKFVGSTYEAPKEHYSDIDEFNPREFLDSVFVIDGEKTSLRLTVQNKLLRPILRNISEVKRGEKLPKETPIAAILFGPPGTSKTQLAKLIAQHLGWPRLDIDPSHLFRSGLENIQSESNRIFNMLAVLERTVVFFDEFDELTRERTSERSDMISRFLTTAMLPKLSRIADQRKIVFLLATNHIEDFDFAISRPGRFDMLLPVMPPSLDEKFRAPKWSGFKEKVQSILEKEVSPKGTKGAMKVREILEALTFDEFKALFEATKDVGPKDIKSAIERAWQKSTLAKARTSPLDKSKTLLDFYDNQSKRFVRLPPPVTNSRDAT